MQEISIRRAVEADYDALGQVMFRAIHEGDGPYTAAQRLAWMAAPLQGAEWSARLSAETCFVGTIDNSLCGFMTLTQTGYVDLAFILPEHRGKRLFARLLDKVEDAARQNGIDRLFTHASLMAQPAFARCGFVVDDHETVDRNGEALPRAAMSKSLDL